MRQQDGSQWDEICQHSSNELVQKMDDARKCGYMNKWGLAVWEIACFELSWCALITHAWKPGTW